MVQSLVARSDCEYIACALQELCGIQKKTSRVLDFGCGEGRLVQDLRALGFNAQGCDQNPYWSSDQNGLLQRIEVSPYRIPFEDESFDAVVSTSVLEHAQNKYECFQEIKRILRTGGAALHLYPSKWYLPVEPHLNVPLVNYFWPNVPKSWLAFWAIAGVRNEYPGENWKEVAEWNSRYCQTGITYWSNAAYKRLSLSVFGNCSWPMEHFIERAPGGFAAMTRRLPLRKLWSYIARQTRTAVLLTRKTQ